MPSTYTPIATTTLGSNQSSVTFSSISGAYTDLIMVMTGKDGSSSAQDISIQFNSDTGSNYSFTYLYGNGSSAASGRASNNTAARLGYFTTRGTTDGYMAVAHFMNYSNTTTFKTIITRSNSLSSNTTYPGTETIVNLWRSTSAITSVVFGSGTSTFATGSTFTLYGVKSA